MAYDSYETGQRAYNVRDNKNITQTELAEAVGITQASISKFEYGAYDIPLSELVKLCEYLDITVSWLIGEKAGPRLTAKEQSEIDDYTNYVISKRQKQS